MGCKDITLKVLNILMTHEKSMSTRELVNIIGCDRKSIYTSIAKLECNGFPIEVEKSEIKFIPDKYKWTGEVLGF